MRLLPSRYYHLVSETPNSVLLESSRPDRENFRSYLFLNPIRLLKARTLEEIPELFDQIESCLRQGWFVAGFMSYECGYHFEPAASKHSPKLSALPLAWFGAYRNPCVFNHHSGQFESECPPESKEGPYPNLEMTRPLCTPRFRISRMDHCTRIAAIKEYIAAGDVYQVNFTNKLLFDSPASTTSLFASLRDQQKVPYAAFLHLDEWDICSFSPELFFRVEQGHIVTRPMKGTAPRGQNLDEDNHLENWLQGDAKNRSENVMIVDLLRNDLGRISEVGSVRVDKLFDVEKYDTVFQMTSTISGTLLPDKTFYEVFRALFPSGSVTGAPKIRAMQLIQELENEPRGVYTGAIGYFAPNRDAAFSVAIRTLALKGNSGEMGVGGGIVFDSIEQDEFEECQVKARFLIAREPQFDLLESLRWEGSYFLLDLHLKRLEASARHFGFSFDKGEIVSVLEDNARGLRRDIAYKVRLLLSRTGRISVKSTPLESSSIHKTVVVSSHRVSSLDELLYHKTTHRQIFDRLSAEAQRQGHEDIIFLNERGEITEGARNNVFVKIRGRMFTPPIECGLLPGVFRRHLLANDCEPRVMERVLTMENLKTADAIFVGNSVRGLRQVSLVDVQQTDDCCQKQTTA